MNKKLFCLLLPLILVTCSFSVSAQPVRDENIVDFDLFYILVPDIFIVSDEAFFDDDVIYETDDSLVFEALVFDNMDGFCASEATEEKIIEIHEKYYCDFYSSDGVNNTVAKKQYNGYTAAIVTGDIVRFGDVYKGLSFLFSTEECVYVLHFERFNKEFTENDMSRAEGCVSTFLMNGTMTGTDAQVVPHEFNYDNEYSTYYPNGEFIWDGSGDSTGNIEEEGELEELIFGAFSVLLAFPALILLIAAIILLVKYSKRKKILKNYEATYGPLPTVTPQMNGMYAPYANANRVQNGFNAQPQGGFANVPYQNQYAKPETPAYSAPQNTTPVQPQVAVPEQSAPQTNTENDFQPFGFGTDNTEE